MVKSKEKELIVIKWPGGKTSELKYINPNIPSICKRFFEPFVGGGSVFINIREFEEYYINDKSEELISVYKYIKSNDILFMRLINNMSSQWQNINSFILKHYKELLEYYVLYRGNIFSEVEMKKKIYEFIQAHRNDLWESIDKFLQIDSKIFDELMIKYILDKFKRTKSNEIKNGSISKKDLIQIIEGAFKSGYYMYYRDLYNRKESLAIKEQVNSAIFYFIREYCYSSMFRYNNNNEFNVPYGGISYNKNLLNTKINKIIDKNMNKFQNVKIFNLDFEEFFGRFTFSDTDFIFLDPPYDSDFNTYAQNEFTLKDQERLANCLATINAKFMMIIKNTPAIYNLYNQEPFKVSIFEKKYLVNFKNRNLKDVKHLIITNYDIEN